MKRYILTSFLSVAILFTIYGQANDTIFSGAVSGNVTWDSYDTVYVTGAISIGSGNSLTIEPNTGGSNAGNNDGVYIVFRGAYGITVTGTGALNTSGTASDSIYFTADRDKDHVFGETGETWKNLLFDYSSGTSLIDYAVIEYGYGDDYGFGGGIDIYADNVTIRNSSVRYCSVSGDGGGIYAYGSNNAIENVSIHDNSAIGGSGGGMYIDDVITIEDCEIYDNSASTNGDGVFMNVASDLEGCKIYNHTSGEGIYNYTSGSTFTNCIIYDNSTGIYLYKNGNVINSTICGNTTGVISAAAGSISLLVNTVFWGNTTEYSVLSGTFEIAYCSIEGGFTGGTGITDGGNNVTLSSTNDADTGPNFVDSSNDFQINSWVAPMVDAGASSYSGLTIPSNDKLGNDRISTPDIGAYEFQYLIWEGDTSDIWTDEDNWQGSHASIPTSISENKVIIPAGAANYPTVSSLTLSSRSYMVVEPGAGVTVTGATSVQSGCTFLLESDATGNANFISGTEVTGDFDIELYLAGGGGPNYKWHYVTTPENGYTTDVLTTDISNQYNLLNYDESKVVDNQDEGWNWYDGYNGTTPFGTLIIDRGYNVYVDNNQTALFTATPVDHTLHNILLSQTLGSQTENGWNLVGNSFTSGIDLDLITISGADQTVYFTKDNGYQAYNIEQGIGINGGNDTISSLQGFFVHVTTGRTKRVTIPASSRVYADGNPLLKKGSSTKKTLDFPLLKFNIADGDFTDESVIYLFDNATVAFDTLYDGYKMFHNNPLVPQIYSVAGDLKLCMNGLPLPGEEGLRVPIKLRIGETKNYTFNVVDLENLDFTTVTLEHGDNVIDLENTSSYTFLAEEGTVDDMYIVFGEVATNIELPGEDMLRTWYHSGLLSISMGSDAEVKAGSVSVYDFNGRLVREKRNVFIERGETITIPINLQKGLFIVKVNDGFRNYVKKIAVAN